MSKLRQAASNFFAWFNRHYPAPSNHPDHEWNQLGAALAEPEPRNQCAETCERAKLCAVCLATMDDAMLKER
jgi:hypothetical protein